MSRLARLALGAGLLVALTACEKPSPAITLVSNGTSVHFEAQQWCEDGATLLSGDECPGTGDKPVEVLRVRDGDQVAIDVDKELREPGWYLYDADAKENITGVRTDAYYALENVLFAGRPTPGIINLEVRTVDAAPQRATDVPKVTGQWKFQLVQADD